VNGPRHTRIVIARVFNERAYDAVHPRQLINDYVKWSEMFAANDDPLGFAVWWPEFEPDRARVIAVHREYAVEESPASLLVPNPPPARRVRQT